MSTMFFTLNFRPSRLALAVAVAATGYAGSSSAEETAEAKKSVMPAMEVVKVVGQKEDHRFNATGSVNLVELEEIQRVQPLSTEDVLRRIPGINIKSEEETSVIANFGIRGLSASESKSLLLEDGVPVAPGLFIGNDRYFNPRIQRVERVEVLKGSSSLRYGPSTIGGVVNYQTKTPDDGVELSARAGSFNMKEVGIEAGNKNAAGDAFAGIVATHATSDGFMDKGYTMNDVMAKAGVEFANNQKLGVKLSWYENDVNMSYRGLLLNDYKAGADYNPAPDDDFLADRVAFDINHEWQLSDTATLKTLVYWSDVTRDYWRYAVDTNASVAAGRWVYTDNLTGNNRSFERTGAESRLTLEQPLFGLEASTEFGLRLMHEKSNDLRINTTRAADRTGTIAGHLQDSADSVAGYVQSRIVLSEKLALTPGLRIESYQQERLNLQSNALAKTSNTEYLPGVGLTYELTDAAQLYAGVYRAFSPASNSLALDGLTDQQLDGERSVNYEVGVRGVAGSTSYEVAAFIMDFSNQVVTGNSNTGTPSSNAGETSHYGMEFSVSQPLMAGLNLDANATWVPESEFEAGTNQGNRIPYAPKILANLGLNYQLEQLNLSLNLHHRGEQFGNEANTIAIEHPAGKPNDIWGGLLPAYTVVDLLSQYQISDNLTVSGSVKNLTDKRYISGLRQGIYVGPERSFEIGARYRF
ncbi:TonB-dependent siderophore receptor [Rheinheimera soli]|uniref:Fe(3+) dicitrate transport protein n=1 Tax=Rheinheimera soli TaxID=443616 RepID=A0ABU1VU36_9GAMM|nr:TonB-dependent siderophore receptor [Rheinheimera soli]MDR7119125.1 Fe(3+) dicitrate transport protein [Rheinheimera soli]